jgi:predicted nucleic acid-binding protein
MALRHWVVNASPLIFLGKADCLDLLCALADSIVVPKAVVDEVSARPDGKATLRLLADQPPYTPVDDTPVSAKILSWDLGPGETQVIAQAQRFGAERAVLDDLEARRCAKAMGLAVIGTLGIVGRAKARGLIDKAEPIVMRLREKGLYASEELVQRILHEVGE